MLVFHMQCNNRLLIGDDCLIMKQGNREIFFLFTLELEFISILVWILFCRSSWQNQPVGPSLQVGRKTGMMTKMSEWLDFYCR